MFKYKDKREKITKNPIWINKEESSMMEKINGQNVYSKSKETGLFSVLSGY